MTSYPELTREQIEELLLQQNAKVAKYEEALQRIALSKDSGPGMADADGLRAIAFAALA